MTVTSFTLFPHSEAEGTEVGGVFGHEVFDRADHIEREEILEESEGVRLVEVCRQVDVVAVLTMKGHHLHHT